MNMKTRQIVQIVLVNVNFECNNKKACNNPVPKSGTGQKPFYFFALKCFFFSCISVNRLIQLLNKAIMILGSATRILLSIFEEKLKVNFKKVSHELNIFRSFVQILKPNLEVFCRISVSSRHICTYDMLSNTHDVQLTQMLSENAS